MRKEKGTIKEAAKIFQRPFQKIIKRQNNKREKIVQDVNFSSSYVSMPNSLTIKECLRVFSILYTSHNMKEIEEMSDRIIFLHRGRIIAKGRPGEVIQGFNRKSLEEVCYGFP